VARVFKRVLIVPLSVVEFVESTFPTVWMSRNRLFAWNRLIPTGVTCTAVRVSSSRPAARGVGLLAAAALRARRARPATTLRTSRACTRIAFRSNARHAVQPEIPDFGSARPTGAADTRAHLTAENRVVFVFAGSACRPPLRNPVPFLCVLGRPRISALSRNRVDLPPARRRFLDAKRLGKRKLIPGRLFGCDEEKLRWRDELKKTKKKCRQVDSKIRHNYTETVTSWKTTNVRYNKNNNKNTYKKTNSFSTTRYDINRPTIARTCRLYTIPRGRLLFFPVTGKSKCRRFTWTLWNPQKN